MFDGLTVDDLTPTIDTHERSSLIETPVVDPLSITFGAALALVITVLVLARGPLYRVVYAHVLRKLMRDSLKADRAKVRTIRPKD